jgi:Protein of unknown function (DUF2637)
MLESIGAVIRALRERADSLMVATAMAVVAFCSGFISYTHISALTQNVGGSWKTAHLMPFCVDGQIVIGSAYFMYGKSWKSKSAGLAFGVIPGIAESLIANWESGIVHGLFAAGWATVPAQAFACSTILFERWLHARREAALAVAPAASELSPQAAGPAAPVAQEAGPVAVHLHRAPEGAPWGLVSPAVAPAPEREAVRYMPVPTLGPAMRLSDRAAPRQRAAAAQADDARLPLPGDPAELRALVNSMTRNKIWETYQVSKGKADALRKQYLNEEVTTDAA